MPKLNLTTEQLERIANIVTGDVPSPDWTDNQYPSARTLYKAYEGLANTIATTAASTVNSFNENSLDTLHPIGSLLITATNINPGETLGGTWELVDKTFKAATIALTSDTFNNINYSSLGANSVVLLSDHTMVIRLLISSDMIPFDSDVSLGQLVLESCGVTALPAINSYAMPISETNATNNLPYQISADGTIVSLKTTKPATTSSTSMYIQVSQIIDKDNMKDTFCNKFYWKRMA